MSRRSRVAIGAMFATAFLLAAPAAASGAGPDVVAVSGDGVTFTRDYRDVFGTSILVPRGTASDTFFVRNTGNSAGILRLVLTNVNVPDGSVLQALTLSTGTADVPGTPINVSDASPCITTLQGQPLAAGQTVQVTSQLTLGDLTGTTGQNVPIDFSIQVELSDRRTAASTECAATGIPPTSPVPPSSPSNPGLSETGLSIIVTAVTGAALLAAGTTILSLRRSRRTASSGGTR